MEHGAAAAAALCPSCWATLPRAARLGPGATPPGAPGARSRSSPSLSSHRRKAGAQPEPAELFAQQEEEPVPWAGDQEDDEDDDNDDENNDDGQDTWAFEQDE